MATKKGSTLWRGGRAIQTSRLQTKNALLREVGFCHKSLEIFSSVNVNEATRGESWRLHVHHKVAPDHQQRSDLLSFLRKDAGFIKKDPNQRFGSFRWSSGIMEAALWSGINLQLT